MAGALVADPPSRPGLAAVLVGVAFVVTGLATILLRTAPHWLLHPAMLGLELLAGVALVTGDALTAPEASLFATRQALGGVWPVVGVLSFGFATSTRWGTTAGALLGASRAASVYGVVGTDLIRGETTALLATTAFYALAGAASGHAGALLRRAERDVASARAREDLARTLHDTALQALVHVQRAATDPALVTMARDAERDLRTLLFAPQGEAAPVVSRLRAHASRVEHAFGLRVTMSVVGDVRLSATAADALVGAVGEALTNAGRHADASRVTVFVEVDDDGGVFASVADDGRGFSPEAVRPGAVGVARSIRARVAEAGGRSEVRAQPGHGTEVLVWLR